MEEEKKMELFSRFRKDPKLREAIGKTVVPDDPEKTLILAAGLAKEFGYALSEEDIREVLDAAEQQRKTKTEKAIQEIEHLPDDNLARVAGGGYYITCEDTYLDRENCWKTDGCDQSYNMYPEYECQCNHRGGDDPECGWQFAARHCQGLLTWTCEKSDIWP